MIKNFIPQQEIKRHHPKGMASHTDGEYTQLASDLLQRIDACQVKDLTAQERRNIAVNLALYYEDILADAGIWRGFTDKMRALYGKPLPFYDINGDDYLPDEPHREDVQFIIWLTITNLHSDSGKMPNPETPAIVGLANALYPYMDNLFEELPVNDDLADFFAQAKFMDDFYLQRDVLKWLCYDCYLTALTNTKDVLLEEAKEYMELYDYNPSSCLYLAESLIPYEKKTGPLALLPQQWLGLILRANGHKKMAEWAESQLADDFNLHRLVSEETGKSVTLEDTQGQTITVYANDFSDMSKGAEGSKVVLGTFVRYRDKWYPNADSTWSSEGLDIFESLKKEEEGRKDGNIGPKYDQLLEQSGGNPFFYFANRQELVAFLTERLGAPADSVADLEIPTGKDFALGLMGSGKPFAIMLKGATCLCDKRNPFYDKAKAKGLAAQVAMYMPAPLLKYAMDHDMLPDASVMSIRGEEHGRKIFQENYDFLVRAIMRDKYVEG